MIQEAGIYFIECLKHHKKYIGSSSNMRERFYGHFRDLKNNCHKNKELQSDYNLFGEENFIFAVLEIMPNDDKKLEQRESYWINKIDFVYNVYNAFRVKPEGKNKASQKLFGKNNPMYNVKCVNHPNSNSNDLQVYKDIKSELNKETNEKVKDKIKRLSEKYNISERTIKRIKYNDHWSCK